MRRDRLLPVLVTALALVGGGTGCDDPPVDDFRSAGGASPDPTGVIEGTVLYVGPRPTCYTDETGLLRPTGRVILTLFEYDNPPPPAGAATTAENLLTVPGLKLFPTPTDCMPESPTAEQRAEVLMRSVDFTWPEIELGHAPPGIEYQIKGFYDTDGDFNPFFSATNQPTRGDIGGGAFENLDEDPLIPARISFGCAPGPGCPEAAAAARPNGDVFSGVAVTLGAPINTERPTFFLSAEHMSSEATLPTTSDIVMAEAELYNLAKIKLNLYRPRSRGGADAAVARLTRLRTALDAAGLELDVTDPVAYAWYVRSIDADADGTADMHPILGDTQGIRWETPLAIMLRARSPLEIQARIPNVLLIPTVRPTKTMFQRVHYPSMEMAIAPVAVVQTNLPDECRIPYITPGNPNVYFERITAECHEVPTGQYGINVIHGLAGATQLGGGVRTGCDADSSVCLTGEACVSDQCVVPALLSPTERDLQGGSFSGQVWSLPNELGSPVQLPGCVDTSVEDFDPTHPVDCDPSNENLVPIAFVEEQGVGGLFIVEDPDGSNAVGRATGRDSCQQGLDILVDPPAVRDIEYLDFSEYGDRAEEVKATCCGPVLHLCGVPLCEMGDLPVNPLDPDSETFTGRLSPTSIDENGVPNCLPFAMPVACCPAAP